MVGQDISKMYDRLTPEERVSAMLAAFRRDDETEVERLNTSAPRLIRSCVHHTGVARALYSLALMHRAEQLELVGHYLLAQQQVNAPEDGRTGETDFWLTVAVLAACTYCVNKKAWARFCRQKHVCPEDLTAGLPGETLDDLTFQNLGIVSPDGDEFAAILENSGIRAAELTTVDSVVGRWDATYRELLGNWPI